MRSLGAFAALIAATVVPHAAAAVEYEIFGVALGERYDRTLEALGKKYGKPIQSARGERIYDAFQLDPKADHLIIIESAPDQKEFVTAIQLSGTTELQGLEFLGGLNLGRKAEAVELLFPATQSRPSSDGYTLHSHPGTNNFSIETKDGKVTSIRIDSAVGVNVTTPGKERLYVLSPAGARILRRLVESQGRERTDELIKALGRDTLRPHCDYRYPLRIENQLPLADVLTVSPKGTRKRKFLLDSGWTLTTIRPELCKDFDCKPAAGSAPAKASGKAAPNPEYYDADARNYLIGLGREMLRFDPIQVREEAIFGKLSVDGVLGADFFTIKPMIFNFKDEYVCFPKDPVARTSMALKGSPVPARMESLIRVDPSANGSPLKDYFIDTGSNHTSLMAADIERLGLKKIGTTKSEKVTGTYTADTYGPVELELGGRKVRLDEVTLTRDEGFRKLGTDFIEWFHLGVDAKEGKIYLIPH